MGPTQLDVRSYRGSSFGEERPDLEADCSPSFTLQPRLEMCVAVPQLPTVRHCAHRHSFIIYQSTWCQTPECNFNSHHRQTSHLKNVYQSLVHVGPSIMTQIITHGTSTIALFYVSNTSLITPTNCTISIH